METRQPSWKFLANLGDANPAEEGGVFVYQDETGVYPPEAEVLEPHRRGRWKIYRVVLDKCTFIDGVLSDNKFHTDKPAWFADKVDGVINTCDCPKIIEWLCGDDVVDRARAYQSLWEYFGLENFDGYPLTLDPLKERYTQGEV
jgi:hypothetical protein